MIDLDKDLKLDKNPVPKKEEAKPIDPDPPKPIKPEPLKVDSNLRDSEDFGKKIEDTIELLNNTKNDLTKTDDL